MYQLKSGKNAFFAVLMGILLTMAFAPYDYAYVSLISLSFLYFFWYQCGKRAFRTGYFFGLGLFGSGINWVYISIHDYGGADSVSSGLLTGLLVAVWALFPAITGLLISRSFIFNNSLLRITLSALLWVLVEYFRGNWLLNGFPWLQIAYTQLSTPLAGYAPVFGVYGVGFLLAISAFAVVEMLIKKLALFRGLLLIVVIWGVGSLLKTIEWTQSAGEPIKITLLQGNISQGQKWLPDQRLNTLRLYRDMTEQHWDSNVIIWPETAVPAFLSQVKTNYIEPLALIALQHHVDLLLGVPINGQNGEYYNGVLALGHGWQEYHKIHLLPFGEYLPLQPLSGWISKLVQIPLGDFTPGENSQALLSAAGHPFLSTICYEDVFGEQVAKQVEKAKYIVNFTNDAWFGDSSEPYQHMQMAQMRALETGRFLVRATNTGLTGFVAPDGSITKQAPLFTTTALTDSIIPMSGVTPYSVVGDAGAFGIEFIMLGFFYLRTRCLKSLKAVRVP
jgi:apolipoprotein N-acyltransferase